MNDEHQHHHENKKRVDDNIQGNNFEAGLENPDYIVYATSNEKGECNIGQCTNSIVNILGYMKSEIIGKKIEVLMPKIFIDGHAMMLSDTIKKMHLKHHSNRNSYRDNDKKKVFLVCKTKMGYLIPLSSKFTIYEDTDFSNSFIIKSQMEAKDTKSVYAYYILTKNDFSVDSISSSAINLGITMDLLNKYVIQLNLLVRNLNLEKINFMEKISEYEEEPKEIVWIYPDLIYPKDEVNKNRNENIQDLVLNSYKEKFGMQISVMKYNEDEIIGYVFKFVELTKKKKDDEISHKDFIPNGNKEIIFDLLTLNYIRTVLVQKRSGNRNLREKEEISDSDKVTKKGTSEKNRKRNDNNLDDIQESSEEEKKIDIILNKEKILELQTKELKDIENFINLLPYYGSDVSLEKHRPNKERYPVGRGHEPLIKIDLGHFTKKIENRIRANPDMMKRFRVSKDNEGNAQNNNINSGESKTDNDYNHEFSSDTSTSLANIFNSKSVLYIKITSAIMFLLILIILSLEFIFTFLNMQHIKNQIGIMHKSYILLNNICYTKYFITEAVLANEITNYIILTMKSQDKTKFINDIKEELAKYREEFSNIYSEFSSSSIDSFSKDYRHCIETNITVRTFSNGVGMEEEQAYSTAMNRIPTTVFYVSTISDQSLVLNMSERNSYELMENLLNGYFIALSNVTNTLVRDAVKSSKLSLIATLLFIGSFIFNIIFLLIFWKVLNSFLEDREKPINLFLTIKKKIFEDLKNASESFSNKLLNKFFGNEDNEEESQKDYQTNIKITDINIIKFKAPNEYKSTGKKNKEHLRNFMKLIIFFLFLELYMIFKFFYSDSNVNNFKKFIYVFNVTQFSNVDTILSVDVLKSYFFNKSIPILNINITTIEQNIENSPFYISFYDLTKRLENMLISTSKTDSFLKGDYKETFSQYLYHNFSKMFLLEKEPDNQNLFLLFENGFKPIAFNIFEKLRFFWLQEIENRQNIINNPKWFDLDYLLTYVVRPWYNSIIDIMNKSVEHFMNNSKLVQITLFIVVLVIIILAYCIIWKSYEEQLTLLLKRSFDLINLIPEEIKYLIVSKLNE